MFTPGAEGLPVHAGLARQMHFVQMTETVLHWDHQKRKVAIAEKRKRTHELSEAQVES